MKFLKFFISGILIIIALVSGTALFCEKFFGRKNIENELFNNLISIVESKANQTKVFLSKRKEDASLLAKIPAIKKDLKKSVISGEQIGSIAENELRNFKKVNYYQDILLLSRDGDIVWSSMPTDGLEEKIKKGFYEESKLIEIYGKSKETRNPDFVNIKLGENDINLLFAVAPVFDGLSIESYEEGETLIGFVVLQISNSILNQMISKNSTVDKIGEIYLVDRDKFNITPLKITGLSGDNKKNISYSNNSKKISSKSIDSCLNKESGPIKDLKFYENYAGDKIFGTYQYIPGVNWCVLAEINQKDLLNSFPGQFKNILLFFGIGGLITLIIGIIFSLIFSEIYIIKKRGIGAQKTDHSFCKIAFAVFLLIMIILDGFWLYKIYIIPDKILASQVYDHLTNVTKSRGERMEDYLNEKKKDINLLISSPQVKEILKSETASKEEDAKRDSFYTSNVISKEIENYLRANSKMNISDLIKSWEFRQIVVQTIGKTGYSALLDSDSKITYLHKNQKIEGISLHDIVSPDHEMFKISDQAIKEGEAGGVYDWIDLGGEKRKKYIYVKKISIKTADNVSLLLGATSYIDEYKTIKNVPKEEDEYLSNFKKSLVYHNIILISPDDYIVYMAKEMEKLGIDLKFDESGLGEAYREYLNNREEVFFYGPFSFHSGELALKVVLMAPVYEDSKFLGTVSVVFDMSEITRIASELTGLGKTGEDYLVNKEGLLISPLRFKYFDFLIQSIKTENLLECLKDYRQAREKKLKIEEFKKLNMEKISNIETFQNYRGEISIGTYFPIPELNWCLITEMGKEEVFETPKRERSNKDLAVLLGINFIIIVFVIIKGKLLCRRCSIKRKK